MLKIASISKRFGATEALRAIDFEVRRGEFFSLLGPSGCGKTTLLRILSGFAAPDAGRLLLDGRSIEREPPHRRPCNMIFQRYALFPHLDVAGNIAFGLQMKKLARVEIEARVAEAVATVEMQGFERRRVQTLSGGQQQRVAIARAIVNRPEFLLLDEPLAALDLKLRQRMQIELRGLQRRLGITFIYVTHAQDEALSLSDRIAVMRDGRIEQIGKPEEIYLQPVNAFVASFIGSINALRGEVIGRDGSGVVVRLGNGMTFRAHGDVPLGRRVIVMVRPEDLSLAPAERPAEVSLEVVVKDVLFRGATAEIVLEEPVTGSELTMQLSGAAVHAAGRRRGERTKLTWPPDQALVLADDGGAFVDG